MTLGLVCDRCDALCPLSASTCVACGAAMGIARPHAAETQAPAQSTPLLCISCKAEITPGHRFCGRCGKPVALEAADPPARRAGGSKTMFFGAMQAPGRAKLILIKGEGLDGVSYVLSATEHTAGRTQGAILFPEDPLLSPRHANFLYRDGKLYVRDEGSANGVFVRIVKPQTVAEGARFLVGEQLLQLFAPMLESQTPSADGTFYYASPARPSRIMATQLLVGGQSGLVFRALSDTLTIGREGNDINFPDDPFISGCHATVQAIDTPDGPRFTISDLGSKNGTFLRITEEKQLDHGDYVFLGQQLLRVEIT